MTRTVHRLKGELSFINLSVVHILMILLIVTRSVPKIYVKNLRCNNFLVIKLAINPSHEIYETVINNCSFRHKEWRSRSDWIKDKKLKLFTKFSMVTFLSFFHLMKVLL